MYKIIVLAFILVLLIACSPVTPTPVPTPPSVTCDQSLWAHVYNPARLQIIQPCIAVTGTVRRLRAEADGDFHIRVTLDPPYVHLINDKNISDQGGDLVVETMCVVPVTQADAQEVCKGWIQPVHIPSVGDHVRLTGAYVLDTSHGWMELHPVTSIESIP